MQKSGIKSFIFSFILTLSTVLMVDNMLPCEQKNDTAKKISYKNIALFSEDKNEIIVASATTSPQKEASLSNTIAEGSLVQETPTQDAALSDLIDNDKEIENKENSFSNNDNYIVAEQNIVNPIEDDKEYSFDELMAMNNISYDKEEVVIPEKDNSIVVANDVDAIPNTSAETEEKETIVIADNSFDENINLWLPIEKGETNTNFADDTQESQIALADASVMLSSVTEEEKAKVETFDDAIKVAKSAGLIQKRQESTDSPWIVAKGAKYAKNRKQFWILDENFQESESKEKDDQNNRDVSATDEAVSEKETSSTNLNSEESKKTQESTQNVATEEPSADTKDIAETVQEEAPAEKIFSLNKITDDKEVKTVSGVLTRYPKENPDGSVDVAYKVMNNLIIPIPEEILEDDNLTPQLVASDKDDSDENLEKAEKEKSETKKTKKKDKKERSSLFKNISSFFSSSRKKSKEDSSYEEYDLTDDDEEDDDDNAEYSSVENVDNNSDNSDKLSDLERDNDYIEFSEILPTEMKLSFQPERAEISGSTLRWLRAFAENAKSDPNVYIEIRIDGSGAFALQQKRLNLLQGVFLENGVKPSKIDTIFTSREPNSFIIRNLKINNNKEEENNKKKEVKTYYQTW